MSNLLLYKNYGDVSCSTPPVQLNYVTQPSLAVCQANASSVIGCATSPYFLAYTAECLSITNPPSQTYESTAAKVFGSAPYVQASIYSSATCNSYSMYNLRQYRVGACYQFNGSHEDPLFSFGGLSRRAQVRQAAITGKLTDFAIEVFSDLQCKNYFNIVSFVADAVECQETTFFNSQTSYVVFNVVNSNAISSSTATGSGGGSGPSPTGTSPSSGIGSTTVSSDFVHSTTFYFILVGALVVFSVGMAIVSYNRRKFFMQYGRFAGGVNHAPSAPLMNYSASSAAIVPGPSIVASQNGLGAQENQRLGVYSANQYGTSQGTNQGTSQPPAYSITADRPV
ncbi:UNVERIFIED_CONTAM: hypothetical protein HDU68_001907 [Siphonaria sp. JEL0065]|nr:hypothetical protein HDU68_001907 [Siphonaria sp. JEL0065]